jgi:hypothetical protein
VSVLCCAVLCCAVLCCAVLCCAVLCCAVPCCVVPTQQVQSGCWLADPCFQSVKPASGLKSCDCAMDTPFKPTLLLLLLLPPATGTVDGVKALKNTSLSSHLVTLMRSCMLTPRGALTSRCSCRRLRQCCKVGGGGVVWVTEIGVCLCVCECVCACVRACVHACVVYVPCGRVCAY